MHGVKCYNIQFCTSLIFLQGNFELKVIKFCNQLTMNNQTTANIVTAAATDPDTANAQIGNIGEGDDGEGDSDGDGDGDIELL